MASYYHHQLHSTTAISFLWFAAVFLLLQQQQQQHRYSAQAFTIQSTHTWSGIQNQVAAAESRGNQQRCLFRQSRQRSRPSSSRSSLEMRDHSASYWFQVGDTVQVVDDVLKAGTNLRGRQGKVVETWEKCDVDPTCCCAEQVDIGMAVRVEFEGSVAIVSNDDTTTATSDESSSFVHYFAEAELKKVVIEEEAKEEKAEAVVAFDGMSCVDFKLDRLKMGKQAQRIASFEASRRASEDAE